MAIERTLSIIKPDATKRNLTGKINAKFEEAGLRIVAQKRIHLSMAQAGAFYAEHKERGSQDGSGHSTATVGLAAHDSEVPRHERENAGRRERYESGQQGERNGQPEAATEHYLADVHGVVSATTESISASRIEGSAIAPSTRAATLP